MLTIEYLTKWKLITSNITETWSIKMIIKRYESPVISREKEREGGRAKGIMDRKK